MELLIIEGEFRSFIRNALERVLKIAIPKGELTDAQKELISLSYRMVASLLAVYIFTNVKDIPNIRLYVTLLFLGIFGFHVYRVFAEK